MYGYYQQPQGMYNNPYMQQMRQPDLQTGLIKVTGIEGAKAYQMQPNCTTALFDNNNDLFYVKKTDGAGFPTIRTFSFKEENTLNGGMDAAEYVSKEELASFKKELMEYVKQSISTAEES